MNWLEVIESSDAFLSKKGVCDSRANAEFLAARLLRVSRGDLVRVYRDSVSEKFLDAMRRGIKRLSHGEPVQYVIGEWDFRHLTLKCDKRALIPRPETEGLVERVLKHLNEKKPSYSTRPFIVDVGTGTGAIILSLAAEYRYEGMFLGTDISEDAITLAKENAALSGLSDRVKFAVADGLEDFDEPQIIDVIVSNPPYIATKECECLERNVRDFEPRLALDGGESGLDFYDRYLSDALNVLKPGGAVFFEIGENQGELVRELMFAYGFSNINIEKDYAAHDRYAFAILD